jgi:hypothetical protein
VVLSVAVAVVMSALAGAFLSVPPLRVTLVAVLSMVGRLLLAPVLLAILALWLSLLAVSVEAVSVVAFGLFYWVRV